jgi:ABC-type uncharacterized transport system ATPase subunit
MVLGLFGTEWAGKTTAVRILTTLLRPDWGSAQVGPGRPAEGAAQAERSSRRRKPTLDKHALPAESWTAAQGSFRNTGPGERPGCP